MPQAWCAHGNAPTSLPISLRTLASFFIVLVVLVVDGTLAASISVPCLTTPQTVGSSGNDLTLSGCNFPTMIVTVVSGNSFTVSGSTIAGMVFSFTGQSSISSFSLVVSSSTISSNANHLLAFSMPLLSSSVAITSSSKLTTVGGYSALSIAGQSQIASLVVAGSTISVQSGAMVLATNGWYGASNTISISSSTLTGAGPAFFFGSLMSAAVTLSNSGGSISLTSGGALFTTTGSAVGFTFAASLSAAVLTCDGGLFLVSGSASVMSVSLVGLAATGVRWDTNSASAPFVSIGGSATQVIASAQAVTLTTLGTFLTVGSTASNIGVTLSGATLRASAAGTAFLQLGASTLPYHSVSISIGPSSSPAIASTSVSSASNFFSSSSGDVASFSLTATSTTISAGSSFVYAVSTLGTAIISLGTCSITAASGQLVRTGTTAATPMSIVALSSTLTASSSAFLAAAPWSGTTAFVFSACSLTMGSGTMPLFELTGALQPQFDLTLVSSTFSVSTLISFANGVTACTLTYLSTQGSCLSHCIYAGSTSSIISLSFGKETGSAVVSKLTTVGGSLVRAVSVTTLSIAASSSTTIAGQSGSTTLFQGTTSVSLLSIALDASTISQFGSAEVFGAATISLMSLSMAAGSTITGGGVMALFSSGMQLSVVSTNSVISMMSDVFIVQGSLASSSSIHADGSTFYHADDFLVVTGSMLGLQLDMFTSSITSGCRALSVLGSATYTWNVLYSTVKTGCATQRMDGTVTATFTAVSASLSTAVCLFNLANAGTTSNDVTLSLSSTSVTAPSNSVFTIAGTATSLSITLVSCTIGTTGIPIGNSFLQSSTVGSMFVSVIDTSIVVGTSSSGVVQITSLTTSATFSFTSSTIQSASTTMALISCGGSTATAHSIVITGGNTFSLAGSIATFSGAVSALTMSIDSLTFDGGNVLYCASSCTDINVHFSSSTATLLADVFTFMDAVWTWNAWVTSSTISSAGGSFVTFQPVTSTTATSLALSISSTSCTFWHFFFYTLTRVTVSSCSLTLSASTLSARGSLMYLQGPVTMVSATVSSTSITSSVYPSVALYSPTMSSASFTFTSVTLQTTVNLLSVSGISLTSVGWYMASSTATVTATTNSLGVFDFGSTSGTTTTPTISITSSSVTVTNTGALAGSISFGLLRFSGAATYVTATLKCISTTFSPDYSLGSFATYFLGMESTVIFSGSSAVFLLQQSALATNSNSRQIVTATSSVTVSQLAIQVSCLSWLTSDSIIMALDGTVASTSITLDSVALWKTSTTTAIRFNTAASSANKVVITNSRLFAPNIISVAAAANIASISFACSWHANYPMVAASFDPVLQSKASSFACSQLYHSTCFRSVTETESMSTSRTGNQTLSRETLSSAYSVSLTNTSGDSGSSSLTPSAISSATRSSSDDSKTKSRSHTIGASVTASASHPTLSDARSLTLSLSLSVPASLTSSGSPTLSGTVSISDNPTATDPSVSPTFSATWSLTVSKTSDPSLSASDSASVTASDAPSSTSTGSVSISRTKDTSATFSASTSGRKSATKSPSRTVSLSTSRMSPTLSTTSLASHTGPSVTLSDSVAPWSRTVSASGSAMAHSASGTLTGSDSQSPSRTQSVTLSSSALLTETTSHSPTPRANTHSETISTYRSSSTSLSSQPTRYSRSIISTFSPSLTRAAPSMTWSYSRTRSLSVSVSPSAVPASTSRSTTSSLALTGSAIGLSSTNSGTSSASLDRRSATVVPTATRTRSKTVGSLSRSADRSSTRSVSKSASPTWDDSSSNTPSPSWTSSATAPTVSKDTTHSLSHTASSSPTAGMKTRSATASASLRTITAQLSLSASSTLRFSQTATPTPIRSVTKSTTVSESLSFPMPSTSSSVSGNPSETTSASSTRSSAKSRTNTPSPGTITYVVTTESVPFSRTASGDATVSLSLAISKFSSLPSISTSQSPTTASTRSDTRLRGTLTFSADRTRSTSLTGTVAATTTTTLNQTTVTMDRNRTQSRRSHSASVSASPTRNTSASRTSESHSVESPTPTSTPTVGNTTVTASSVQTASVTESARMSQTVQRTRASEALASATQTVSVSVRTEGGRHDALESQTATVTASTTANGATRTTTWTTTTSASAALLAPLAAQRQKFTTNAEKTVTSDCFHGSVGILLPVFGVVIGVGLLNYFLLTTELISSDDDLKVSRLRNYGANHLYVGLLFPCHRRCVPLHVLEVIAHMCAIVLIFALLLLAVPPASSQALRLVLAACAVVLASAVRAGTSRVGWSYWGRAPPFAAARNQRYVTVSPVTVVSEVVHTSTYSAKSEAIAAEEDSSSWAFPSLPDTGSLPNFIEESHGEDKANRGTRVPQPSAGGDFHFEDIDVSSLFDAPAPRSQFTHKDASVLMSGSFNFSPVSEQAIAPKPSAWFQEPHVSLPDSNEEDEVASFAWSVDLDDIIAPRPNGGSASRQSNSNTLPAEQPQTTGDKPSTPPGENWYVPAFALNVCIIFVAFVCTIVAVTVLALQERCNAFSTSIALAILCFDAFVVQSVHAALVSVSLLRLRSKSAREHVWLLHPW